MVFFPLSEVALEPGGVAGRLGRLRRLPVVFGIRMLAGGLVIGPSILLISSLAMGVGFFWDVRSFATAVRRRFEERSFDGALHRKLPSWAYRAFGAWCFVFGIGQFVLFAALER